MALSATSPLSGTTPAKETPQPPEPTNSGLSQSLLDQPIRTWSLGTGELLSQEEGVGAVFEKEFARHGLGKGGKPPEKDSASSSIHSSSASSSSSSSMEALMKKITELEAREQEHQKEMAFLKNFTEGLGQRMAHLEAQLDNLRPRLAEEGPAAPKPSTEPPKEVRRLGGIRRVLPPPKPSTEPPKELTKRPVLSLDEMMGIVPAPKPTAPKEPTSQPRPLVSIGGMTPVPRKPPTEPPKELTSQPRPVVHLPGMRTVPPKPTAPKEPNSQPHRDNPFSRYGEGDLA